MRDHNHLIVCIKSEFVPCLAACVIFRANMCARTKEKNTGFQNQNDSYSYMYKPDGL